MTILDRRFAALLLTILLIGFAPGRLPATAYNWTSGVNGNWNDTTKWTPSGFPNSTSDSGLFNTAGTFTVTLTAPQTGTNALNSLEVENGNVSLNLNGNNLTSSTSFFGFNGNSTSTFNLSGGALLTSTSSTTVSSGVNANVTFNISGSNTRFEGFNGFIAQNGTPTVNINVTGGGQITRAGAGGVVLGNTTGAHVNLLVSGANSTFSNNNSLATGSSGAFSGTVSAGGKLESALISLSDIAGSTTLNVTGSGSQIRSTAGNFTVGGRGTGTSTSSAALTIDNQASGFAAIQLLVGVGGSSGTVSGNLNLSGVGSTLTVGDTTSATNALEVGFNGNGAASNVTGTMNILDGGVVTVAKTSGGGNNHVRIGFQGSGATTTSGLIHIAGTNASAVSKLNVDAKGSSAGALAVGGNMTNNFATGRLEVGTFGEVNISDASSVTTAVINNVGGTIALSGGSIKLPSGKRVANSGQLVGNGSIGRFSGTGIVTVDSLSGSFVRPGDTGASGLLTFESSNVTLQSGSSLPLELGSSGSGNFDRIALTNGSAAQGTGTATVSAGSSISFSLLSTPDSSWSHSLSYDLIDARVVTVDATVLNNAKTQAQSLFAPYFFLGVNNLTLSVVTLSSAEQVLRMTLTIPEPATASMLALGIAAISLRRRR